MKQSQALDFLTKYNEQAQPYLASFAAKKITQAADMNPLLKPLVEYFFQIASKGKKVRGALSCLGYELAGGTDRHAMLFASLAPELFHAGALVQDDLMDKSPMRRGLTAYHKHIESFVPSHITDPPHYAMSQAMLAGDLGYFYAFEALTESGFNAERQNAAMHLFSHSITRVALGQMLDAANCVGGDADHEAVLTVMRYKTAEYTGVMPLLFGAKLASTATPVQKKALEDYGLALGWAFQVQDDLLGVFGDEVVTGKSAATDIADAKNTLLVLDALERANPAQKKRIKELYSQKSRSSEDQDEIRALFQATGAKDEVEHNGAHYVVLAKKTIPAITADTSLQQLLTSLIEFAVNRTH